MTISFVSVPFSLSATTDPFQDFSTYRGRTHDQVFLSSWAQKLTEWERGLHRFTVILCLRHRHFRVL